MTSISEPRTLRTLKKYPNRRLYDTHQSAYVTLDGVREMVFDCQPFEVIDSRTGRDITRSVLLQIVCENEASTATPCFSHSFLEQLVRCSRDPMSVMVGEFLERSLNAYARNQDALRQQMNSVMNLDPVDLMSGDVEPPSGGWHDPLHQGNQPEGRVPN